MAYKTAKSAVKILADSRGINLTKNDLLIEQDWKCAICGGSFKSQRDMHLDHCHETGKIRGVLCPACNVGLGSFKDDVFILASAIEYLEKGLGYKTYAVRKLEPK